MVITISATRANTTNKSNDRLRRVHGYTEAQHTSFVINDPQDKVKPLLFGGDVVATLLRTGEGMHEHVTLALLYVAQLLPRDDTDKTRYISISPSDLSKFNVEGQIMLVKHSQSPIDHAEVIQWSGKFVSLGRDVRLKARTNCVIQVPGKACEPVNHRLFPNVSGELDACDGDTAGQVQQEISVSMESGVWEFPVEELAVLIDVLFRGHCKENDKENGNKRTSSTVSQVIKEGFPYSSEDGALVI